MIDVTQREAFVRLIDYLVVKDGGLLSGDPEDIALERSLVRDKALLMWRLGIRVIDGKMIAS